MTRPKNTRILYGLAYSNIVNLFIIFEKCVLNRSKNPICEFQGFRGDFEIAISAQGEFKVGWNLDY